MLDGLALGGGQGDGHLRRIRPHMAADSEHPTGWERAGGRAAAIAAMLADAPTIAERVIETGTRGEGGDRTLEIDAAAEDVVFAELDSAARRGRALHRGQRGARDRRLRRRRRCSS